MPKNGTNRLERFLATVAGARFIEDAERDAAEKEEAVQKRRDLAAEIAECRRRRREAVPALRRAVEAAERDLAEARAVMRAAQKRVTDARRAEFSEDYSIQEGLRRAEAALARTAHPRVLAALDEVDEALRTWHHTAARLQRWVSRKASNWDGTEEFVKYYGTNDSGVDAMKRRIEDAEKALHALLLVAEPEDAAVEVAVAEARAAIAASAGDPPPVEMREFDHLGQPVGR